MLIFAFIILLFANIVYHSKGINKDVKITFLYLIYLWILLLFSFRGLTVPDTDNYIKYYYSPVNGGELEYLYSLMCEFANSLGLSFNVFLLLFQSILFFLWFKTTRKYFDDIHLPFLVFLSFMGIYYFGIIIRSAMGMCMCYYALTYLFNNRSIKGYFVYYLIVTLSLFFHQAMIVFYFLPFFVLKYYSHKVLLIILLISVILPLTNFQVLIVKVLEIFIKLFSVNKFLSYTQVHANLNFHGIYSLTMIKYLLVAFLFIWLRPRVIKKNDLYNLFLNIYVVGVFLIALTYFITAGNRLAYLFFFFEFVLVGILYENSNLPKKLVFFSALALSVLNYLNLISSIPSMISY